jgi:phosphate:Na+ symporter
MAVLLSLTEVLGGLALFLFGLQRLSSGLGAVAGQRLRILLEWTTRRRLPAYLLGTLLGFLLHSSGATVMMVGFLNAGLIRLSPLLPVLFGANVGTTLSIQVLSLNVGVLTFPAIALGMGLTFHANEQIRAGGRALFGFGLLFLGMEIMGDGVAPYQESLRPVLARLDTGSVSGIALALLAATLITAVLQSSGATIGMCFALIQAGVLTSLPQIMPLVLGAHIGTCITAMLASIGGARPARQLALSHLVFNLFNVSLALLFQEPLLELIARSSPDLLRQTANVHTGVMLFSSLLMLPVVKGFAAGIQKLYPVRDEEEEKSFLTIEAMSSAPTAVEASRKEISRLAELAMESLSICQQGLLTVRHSRTQRIRRNEVVFDTIKDTMTRQLRELGKKGATRRKDLPALDREIHRIAQMERIGDHIKSLYFLIREQRSEPGTLVFGKTLTQEIRHLFDLTEQMLSQLVDPQQSVSVLRSDLLKTTERARDRFTLKMDNARVQPRVFYYYSAYLELFERLARHIELVE